MPLLSRIARAPRRSSPLSRLSAWSVLLLLFALAGACSGGQASPPLPLHATIGPDGGTLAAGSGVTLTVPAGALDHEVTITLVATDPSELPGRFPVSGAFTFAPADLTFLQPVDYRLAYAATRVSSAVVFGELRIGRRDAAGSTEQLAPTFALNGSATFQATRLGTFWVAAPDVVAAAQMFPLVNNDHYEFDSGLTVDVAVTATEPNVSLSVAKVTFGLGGATSGFYFDTRSSQIAKVGTFRGAEAQEIFASGQLLLSSRDAVGTIRPLVASYVGHAPFGDPANSYQGIAETTTEIKEHAPVRTPLGLFDTVRIVLTTGFVDTLPQQGEEVLELWCAPRVGPIAIRSGRTGAVALLTAGMVNGAAVAGR